MESNQRCIANESGPMGEAVIRVALNEGCYAYPDVHEQDLCLTHFLSIRPLGGMEVIAVHKPETWAWFRKERHLDD